MTSLVELRTSRKDLRPLFIYILSVVALILYLYGFFPIESSNLNFQKSNIEFRHAGPRSLDKLAFIVIDALRFDFVMPNDGKRYMPFTYSSIFANQACLVSTKAHSPTVTMPRLKAITSGSISTYIDVVLNFMTSDYKEDNFVNIAAANGLKLVFYGDETWLKLYPNAFLRSDGTNSFFALDYVEVDNNVTRHIDDELKKSDWDIIILHYLGLDHIGHTEGPKSPLIEPKLLEMDRIVKIFSDHFKKLEESGGLKTMVILTGDHGMKDSGGHGGVTYSEITVPLVSVGKPCVSLPGWPEEHTPLQIDIAPTISVLLGQRIPVNNMGKIIPGLLYGMNRNEILKHLETNRWQLVKFKNLLKEDPEMSSIKSELDNWLLTKNADDKVIKHITQRYFQYLNDYSQQLVKSNSDFKLQYLVLGVVLLWTFLIVLTCQFLKNIPRPQKTSHWFFLAGTVLHALSLLSSSFIEEEHQTWYFFWTTFCVLSCLESSDWKRKISKLEKAKVVVPWILLSLAHRLLRKLNQTGDKWAFLPDIKFYLYSEGHTLLLILFLLGIGLVFCCAAYEGCSFYQLTSYGISLSAVIAYRIASGNIRVNSLTDIYTLSRWISEVYLFWTFFAIFIILTFYHKTSMHLVWLLLGSFLLRPHNVILLPLEVFTSREIHKLFCKSEDTVWNTIAHVWMGNLFYFYQGNGNSLSNIDVASGFIGIQSYNPVYAGFMMTAHTMSAHVLSFMLSPKSNLVYALTRLIPVTLYCTVLVFQLHHLFIWSVFSPKLLYEASTTVIFMTLMVCNIFFNFLYALH